MTKRNLFSLLIGLWVQRSLAASAGRVPDCLSGSGLFSWNIFSQPLAEVHERKQKNALSGRPQFGTVPCSYPHLPLITAKLIVFVIKLPILRSKPTFLYSDLCCWIWGHFSTLSDGSQPGLINWNYQRGFEDWRRDSHSPVFLFLTLLPRKVSSPWQRQLAPVFSLKNFCHISPEKVSLMLPHDTVTSRASFLFRGLNPPKWAPPLIKRTSSSWATPSSHVWASHSIPSDSDCRNSPPCVPTFPEPSHPTELGWGEVNEVSQESFVGHSLHLKLAVLFTVDFHIHIFYVAFWGFWCPFTFFPWGQCFPCLIVVPDG